MIRAQDSHFYFLLGVGGSAKTARKVDPYTPVDSLFRRLLLSRIGSRLCSNLAACSRSFILFLALLITISIASLVWYRTTAIEHRPVSESALATAARPKEHPHVREREQAAVHKTAPFSERQDMGLWKAIEDAIRVERVDPTGDPTAKERAIAWEDYHQLIQRILEFQQQGLQGNALYESVEARLQETRDIRALRFFESYRRLQQELDGADLEAMSTAERFLFVRRARQEAFGEEMADLLFFEEEAYGRYKLNEKAVLEDTSRNYEEQQETIRALRNSLQVELASRGTYVSFAEDRQAEMESKLRERFGDRVAEMSAEDRQEALWKMYREELPQELLEKAEQIAARRARREAEWETYGYEREAILNDPNLSFEERQERLVKISEQYNR